MPVRIIAAVMLGMGSWVGCHVGLWRLKPSNAPRMLLLGLLSLAGLAVSLAFGMAMRADTLELWVVVWVDLFVTIGYCYVYAGLARSVSVTLLARLRRCDGGSLPFETLVEEYAGSSRFEDRLRVMDEAGLIHLSGCVVTLTPQGRWLGRGAWVLSRALGGYLQG